MAKPEPKAERKFMVQLTDKTAKCVEAPAARVTDTGCLVFGSAPPPNTPPSNRSLPFLVAAFAPGAWVSFGEAAVA